MSLAGLPRDIICTPYTFCFCYECRFVQKVVKIVRLTHDMLQSVIVSGAVMCALMCYPSSNITYCIACLLCIGVILLNKFNSIHMLMVFYNTHALLHCVIQVQFSWL